MKTPQWESKRDPSPHELEARIAEIRSEKIEAQAQRRGPDKPRFAEPIQPRVFRDHRPSRMAEVEMMYG